MAGTTKTNILIEGVFRFDGVLFRGPFKTGKFDTILTVVTRIFAVGHDGQMFFGREGPRNRPTQRPGSTGAGR